MTLSAATAHPAIDPQADEVGKAALAELQFLCEQRLGIVRSPDYTVEVLAGFEQRIAAVLDALLSRGPQMIPWLTESLSATASPAEVCGIVVALLESRDLDAAKAILAALDTTADEPKLRGMHMALRRGPVDLLIQPLQSWFASGSPHQAAVAAEVLAFHRRVEPTAPRLKLLGAVPDPSVRRAAWRAIALGGGPNVERK